MDQKEIWNKIYHLENSRWNLNTPLPKIFKDKIVLEVGCGNGKTVRSILHQDPKELYAIDFSENAVKIMIREFENVKISCQDIRSILFNNEFFDVVSCNFVLSNMLLDDRNIAIHEMKRVLKPNGIFQFSDFSVGDFRLTGDEIEKDTIIKNKMIMHSFSESELLDIFKDFRIISIIIKSTCPIRNDPKLKRNKIELIAQKL